MKSMVTVFSREAQLLLVKKRLILLALLLVYTIFVVNMSINDYNAKLEKYKAFQRVDELKVGKLTNYTHYTFYGAHLMTVPQPLSEYLNVGGPAAELEAKVDSVVSLNIFANGKSKTIFKNNSLSPFRLNFIMVIIGTLLCLFYGASIPGNHERSKLASSLLGIARQFIGVFIVRLILIAIVLALLYICIFGVAAIKGVNFEESHISCILGHLSVTFGMLFASLATGVFLGAIFRKRNHVGAVITMWIVLAFIIPGVVKSYIEKQAMDIISSHEIEFQQMGIVDDFEKFAVKNFGPVDKENMDIAREAIETYYRDYYCRIEELEDKLKLLIAEKIRLYNKLEIIFPTTFYRLTSNEVSGCGLENYISFYNHLQVIKRQFFRFYVDKCYYEMKTGKPEPFKIKSGNLYKLKSKLPSNFGLGMVYTLAWGVLFFCLSIILICQNIIRTSIAKEADCENVNVLLLKGGFYGFHCFDKDFPGIMLNLFFGLPGKFNGKFVIEETDIVNKKMENFLYLPSIDRMQCEDKAGDYLEYILKLCGLKKDAIKKVKAEFSNDILNQPLPELESIWKLRLMLAVAYHVEREVYILRDIGVGVNLNQVEDEDLDRLESILKRDSTVIDLFTDIAANSWYTGDNQTKMYVIRYKDGEYKVSVH